MTIDFAGYEIANQDGRLSVKRDRINTAVSGDHGADPIGEGSFRMVPSGDVVSWDERCARLEGK